MFFILTLDYDVTVQTNSRHRASVLRRSPRDVQGGTEKHRDGAAQERKRPEVAGCEGGVRHNRVSCLLRHCCYYYYYVIIIFLKPSDDISTYLARFLKSGKTSASIGTGSILSMY